MYCKFCKATVSKNDTHCKNCGAKLDPSSVIIPERNQTMYCRYCGSRVSAQDKECKKCGTVLNEYSVIYKNGKEKKYGKVVGGLVVFASIFLILAGVGYLLLFRGNQTFEGTYFEIPYSKDSWFYMNGNDTPLFYSVSDFASSFLVIVSNSKAPIELNSEKDRNGWASYLKKLLETDEIKITENDSDSSRFILLNDSVYYLKFEYQQEESIGHFYYLIDTKREALLLFKTFEMEDKKEFEEKFMTLLKTVKFL